MILIAKIINCNSNSKKKVKDNRILSVKFSPKIGTYLEIENGGKYGKTSSIQKIWSSGDYAFYETINSIYFHEGIPMAAVNF